MINEAAAKAERFMPLVREAGVVARTHGFCAVIPFGPEWPEEWGQSATMNVVVPSNDGGQAA